MMTRPAVLALMALMLVFGQGAAAAEPQESCSDLTANWPLWSALSPTPWTAEDVAKVRFFPTEAVLTAIRAVPLERPLPASFGEGFERYWPTWRQDVVSRQAAEAYGMAAAAYDTDHFADSIPLFDAVAADPHSPFRAAAAYSAARAAFRLGHFEDGTVRIGRIADDPTMIEFWKPAGQLIARIRYGTHAASLAAAQFVETSRMLTAPTSAVCSGQLWKYASPLERLWRAHQDDFWLVVAEPTLESEKLLRSEAYGAALDWVSRTDPVIEALAALVAGPSFRQAGQWPTTPPPLANVLSLARDRWQASGNPLWAVALAEHSFDPHDVDILNQAVAVVRGWPGLEDRAKAALVWRLVAQQTRILVMTGHPDEALAGLAILSRQERAQAANTPPRDLTEAASLIVDGPTRWLIAQGNRAAARDWAMRAAPAVNRPLDEALKPLLADNVEELYRHPVFALARQDGVVELGALRELFDGWSAADLMAFSRRYDVAPDDRRAMVGAAWIRALALRRWSDVFQWLPDLRIAFPLLGPDIDLIEKGWLPKTKQRLATRLALRTPGLVALPSWARPPGGPVHYNSVDETPRPGDVRAFDPFNPSDGNWWCGIDSQPIAEQQQHDLIDAVSADIFYAEDRWRVRTDTPDAATIDFYDRVHARSERIASSLAVLRHTDANELKELAASGSATQRLATDAVEWARDRGWVEQIFGDKELIAETLHLAVRATRFGCRRPPDNAPWSKSAYQELHRRFPDSEWAKKTPYWFGTIHWSN